MQRITQKVKKKAPVFRKIFTKQITEKRLILRANKEHSKINEKSKQVNKKNVPKKRQFTEEANKHITKLSITLINGKMQIKSAMKHHFTSVNLARMK